MKKKEKKIFAIHNVLTSSAIALWRFDVAVPKHDKTIILCHPSVSSLDSPKTSSVLIAAFFISYSSLLSYTIGCNFCIGSFSIACWEVSFAAE